MTKLRDKVASLSDAERARLALRISRRKTQVAAETQAHIQHDPQNRFEPFPLTDLQQAYWIGRSSAFDIGNVASHCYLELEADFDIGRLQNAWRAMIRRHDMLRAVIHPDGQQQVLQDVPDYEIVTTDLRECSDAERAAQLEAIYNELSHQVLDPSKWPMFDIKAARLPGNKVRVCFSIDALIADGWSLFLIFTEWAKFYNGPDRPLEPTEISFRDYVLAEKAAQSGPAYEADKRYWQDRVKTMTGGPDLPLYATPAELDKILFERRVARLDKERWAKFKEQCNAAELTFNAALIAVYAKVVATWSQNSEFLLSVPQFNRQPLHPHVNQIIGEAASFLPLQVSVDDAQTFRDLAAQTQDRLWHDMDHARYTGVEVLRDLAREKGAAGGVLVPVIYTAAPQLPDGNDASAGVAARELGEVTRAINQTSQVWLDNHVSEQDGELVCDWDSVVNLFPAEMSANMLAAYMRCLEELADNPDSWDQPLSWLSSLTVTADELAVRAANYHELAIPERPVHADIMAQAHKRPQATAVIAGGRQLCYADLDAESSAWAACLLEQGVAEGDRVVVAMEKGWEQIVAVLAVLRAGGIYVPVDPAVPDERLAWLVEKSHAAIVLTQPALVADRVWPQAAKVVEVSSELPQERVAVPPVPEYVPADAIACVIFTSGSTGLPKGVMLTHRGIMSCVIPTVAEFNIDSADCAFGITALHHDLSLFDVFGILGAGGKLVLPDPAGRRDPAHWAELVNQHSVTLWNSVPAMLEMLLEYAEQHAGAVPPSLRNVWLGGDWVPVDIPQRLKAQNAAAQLVTIGGPTETTIWNIWYPVTAVNPDWKSIPYGRPIANTRYYILDEQMQECPDWVTGMMYASGPGVTLGYLDEPELTAAKYVSHPETGARMFCTGDQGRWRGDGTIEFIGRADFQLKIQGQRIEPGEIESALRSHADVAQVVVTAVGEKRGRKQLIAYIVPVAGKSVIDDAAIRDFLASKLPPYMVPPAFITLQELPLTANGKIDRAALPLPDFSSSVQTGDADGDSEIVARVTALVADVLNIEISDPGVNLMSLGANSIDMVRIGNRLEAEFGSRPRMDEIFRLQSTRALAGWYEPAESAKAEQAKPAQSSGSEVVDRIVAETRVMIEPEERDAFKDSRPGVRKDIAGRLLVDLPREVTDEMRERYRSRRSCRNFSLKPVKLQDLSDFVGCLAELSLGENKHKFLYASPGGLNPIQLYLHVKPGRVEGLAEGTYYYHPEQHALMQIAEIAELDRDMHIPFINTPIFDECAFSLFLIADLGSIVPAYGDRSMHFISLEVGAISQLLDMYAAEANIGICHIGTIEFERIAEYFDLKQSHICVHSMVGGAPASSEAAAENESAAGKASDILRRVRELSDQEARTLLDSQKRADGEG